MSKCIKLKDLCDIILNAEDIMSQDQAACMISRVADVVGRATGTLWVMDKLTDTEKKPVFSVHIDSEKMSCSVEDKFNSIDETTIWFEGEEYNYLPGIRIGWYTTVGANSPEFLMEKVDYVGTIREVDDVFTYCVVRTDDGRLYSIYVKTERLNKALNAFRDDSGTEL